MSLQLPILSICYIRPQKTLVRTTSKMYRDRGYQEFLSEATEAEGRLTNGKLSADLARVELLTMKLQFEKDKARAHNIEMQAACEKRDRAAREAAEKLEKSEAELEKSQAHAQAVDERMVVVEAELASERQGRLRAEAWALDQSKKVVGARYMASNARFNKKRFLKKEVDLSKEHLVRSKEHLVSLESQLTLVRAQRTDSDASSDSDLEY